jgi:hypothetical protein
VRVFKVSKKVKFKILSGIRRDEEYIPGNENSIKFYCYNLYCDIVRSKSILMEMLELEMAKKVFWGGLGGGRQISV